MNTIMSIMSIYYFASEQLQPALGPLYTLSFPTKKETAMLVMTSI